MMDFFEGMYNMFPVLGSDIAEHLRGWNGETGDYTNTNLYFGFGLFVSISAILLCIAYYYIINHPRFNRWWHWLAVLVFAGFLSASICGGIAFYGLMNNLISQDLSVSWTDCLGVGAESFILSAVIFFLCSFVIKWGSRNCKHSPCL